ncbi:MAG: hypothetical protein FWD71_21405, partial [Oscillospiraceae bacterium]|nr:hypothetical protein [Oscillospiraceae bacterium]
MFKKRFFIRYFLLTAIFIFAVVIYGGQLLNIQIANGGQYQIANTDDETSTQTFVVSAVRGEIFDRNGVPLVTNRNIYNLAVDGLKLNSATANTDTSYLQIVIDLVNLVNSSGGTVEQDTLPVIDFENPDGTHSYAYSMVVSSSGSNPRDTLNKFLQDNNLSVDESADQLITFLDGKYKIDDYLPPENRDPKLFRKIVGICYDFDRYHVLRGDRRYTLSKDINAQLMTVIKEDSHDYPGAEVDLSYERVYNYPSVMPHLMGTIGLIDAKNVDQYLAKGYSMDATVGKSGIELAFEDYLRGQDGKLVRTYDKDGNVIEEEWKKDANGNEMKPVPGKNVYLTIDIKLQQVAEHSLAKTIDRIHQLAAQGSQPDLNGATANAGAAAVIDPNNGEI